MAFPDNADVLHGRQLSSQRRNTFFPLLFFFLGHGDYMKEELGTVKETFSKAMVIFHIASSNEFLLRLWMKTLS